MLKSKQTNAWLGIRNTVKARNIPDNALADAIDLSLDDSGALRQRPGRQLALALNTKDVYETHDGQAFVVTGGRLKRLAPDLSLADVCATSATEFCDMSGYLWTNDGLQVFGDKAINLKLPQPAPPQVAVVGGDLPAGLYAVVVTNIDPDTGLMSGSTAPVEVRLDAPGGIDVVPSVDPGFLPRVWMTKVYRDRRTGGEVFYDAWGAPLPGIHLNADSFPDSPRLVEWHGTRLCATVDHAGHTGIYRSLPKHYHLWDQVAGFCVIPGTVQCMRSCGSHLIVGTDTGLYATDLTAVTKLADYGVPQGRSMRKHPANGLLYIHTKRGTCVALPFENLTDKKCSLPTGTQCSVHFVHLDGIQQFVALHDSETRAHNRYGADAASAPPVAVAPTETFYLTDGLGNVLTDALGNRLTWN